MTTDRETAEKVRDQLCIDSQCVFSKGCGCIDAIAAALAAEREACAKVAANEYNPLHDSNDEGRMAEQIAAAIRARCGHD